MKTTLAARYSNNPTALHHFGTLLEEYKSSGLASPHMESELATQDDQKYWSSVWEALLYRHFKSLGAVFQKRRVPKSGLKGPDFGITHNGRTIWVEAIVPEPIGIPADYLEPPSSDPAKIKAKTVPFEQKLLRWTAAIKEKRDRFAGYVRDGVVSANDYTVIAVNSCRLQDFAIDDLGVSRLPYAVEATFPIGPLAIPLSRQGQQLGPAENVWRGSLLNKNGAPVRTDNFFDETYKHISAVLGTHQRDLFNKDLYLSLAHNPLATNPLPQSIMGATMEFVCDLSEEEFTLRRVSRP